MKLIWEAKYLPLSLSTAHSGEFLRLIHATVSFKQEAISQKENKKLRVAFTLFK